MLQHHRPYERGNIFFTLFAAVALIGVIGVGIASLTRGPLTTLVTVSRRAEAEAQMQLAHRQAIVESAELASSGDCDADTFVEPFGWKTGTPAPTGGGQLPDQLGVSKQDPWGIEYGYCVWDNGSSVNNAGCNAVSGAGENARRLDGGNNDGYVVIAIISAGPNQTFETTCNNWVDANADSIPDNADDLIEEGPASDDIVIEFTYAEAVASSGGLWSLKTGDPTTATIAKDLEVTGGASFSGDIDLSASPSAALRLGAASLFLPDETEATNAMCDNAAADSANIGILRINRTTEPDSIEICDDPANDGAGAASWEGVASGSSYWVAGDNAGQIYYGGGNVGIGTVLSDPQEALDVDGNIQLTGSVKLSNTNVQWANGQTITGLDVPDVGLQLYSGVAGGPRVTLNGTDKQLTMEDSDVIITGTVATNATAALTVRNSASSSILFARNDRKVGILNEMPSYELDVTGSANTTGGYRVEGDLLLDTPAAASGTILLGRNAGTTGPVSGGNNTLLGPNTGATLTTGTTNILIGSLADVPAAATSRYLNIGNVIHGDLQNKRIGLGHANDSAVSGYDATLEVSGDVDISESLDVLEEIDTNISVSSPIYLLDGLSQEFSDVPDCDDTTEKIVFTASAGWGCGTDEDGFTSDGGGVPSPFERDSGTGSVRPVSTVVTIASDDFLFGGTTLDNAAGTDDDNRMFFDKSKGAFRAGYTLGTQWDDAGIGTASVAFGTSSIASGSNSFTAGVSTAATGTASVALGSATWASNTGSIALGQEVNATGVNAIAFGAGNMTSNPVVSGDGAIAFFMGDHNGANVTAARTFGIFGGRVVIDNRLPATQLVPRGIIDAGSGTDAIIVPNGTSIQRPLAAVTGMIRYNTTTPGFEVREGAAWVAMGASVSDRRVKEDIKPLDSEAIMDRLMKVKTHSFVMKDNADKRKRYGVIAQELESVFPEMIIQPDRTEDMRTIDYRDFIAPLISAVQVLNKENKELETQIQDLKNAHDELKEQVELLSAAAKEKTPKGSFLPTQALPMLWLVMGAGLALAGFLLWRQCRRL
ncbi:MAG: tail fiber domain-containing protein [Alphaproteobacteria bacterium]|nr:tail fiber domain-containing protein [Alphaproteobacteria bacterium]